jgi:eukaryotic-like serine/threonine-protein kinase
VSLDSANTGRTARREALLPERYRALDQIAVGGMGSVWVAEDRLLGRRVAVKVLAEQLASQALFVQRFEREARTAAALSAHPNVITIYDVGEHAERPFIVMAYLPGGTVRDRIEAGPVDRRDAVAWLRDTASALDFAHAQGVVHRDVKPQNLLFDGEGRVIVADLGIARAAYEDSLTGSGELLGTASYISPEQAMGDPATAASDRYSLAVVAYELLTGSRPFAGASFAEQALQQVEAEPRPPSTSAPDLSPDTDAVLLRGLAKDPGERWGSATAFASALGRALGDGASRPPVAVLPRPYAPPAPTEPARRARAPVSPTFTRRSPARIGAVAATLVAAILIGGVALISISGGGGSGSGTQPDRAGRSRAKPPGPARTAKAAPASPAPVVPAAASPALLNQQGFDLMNAGRYNEAVPLLKRAVSGYPPGSTELNYAYALYNLGRALRLAGKPAEAIPYLQRRLGFDNQRDVVRRELAAARAAAAG